MGATYQLVASRILLRGSFTHLNLVDRLAKRVQLTMDEHRPYLSAVEDAIGTKMDYAMLVKIY